MSRGSPLASITKRAQFLAFPALEMQEIGDVDKLTKLNETFLDIVQRLNINCLNISEGAKTQVTARLKILIVPKEYAG